MKVKDLIKKLKDLDPEMRVVCTGFDHSYRAIETPEVVKAEEVGCGGYNEYSGPEHVRNENNAIIDVLVMS